MLARNLTFVSGFAAFAVMLALPVGEASAITLYMSMNSAARLGGLTNIEKGDIVAYTSADPSVVAYDAGTNTWSDSATIFFRGRDHFRKHDGTLGARENAFAINIFNNDSILLTSSTTGRLGTGDPSQHLRDGGSKFDTRDLVLYDPSTDPHALPRRIAGLSHRRRRSRHRRRHRRRVTAAQRKSPDEHARQRNRRQQPSVRPPRRHLRV